METRGRVASSHINRTDLLCSNACIWKCENHETRQIYLIFDSHLRQSRDAGVEDDGNDEEMRVSVHTVTLSSIKVIEE